MILRSEHRIERGERGERGEYRVLAGIVTHCADAPYFSVERPERSFRWPC